MNIMMKRSNGNIENLRNRDNLVRVLYATNKKDGTKALTYSQCGKIADRVLKEGKLVFCNRTFWVEG